MQLVFGGDWPLIWMSVLAYSGSDPATIAAVEAFNGYFSLTMEFGIMAYMFTIVAALISRS